MRLLASISDQNDAERFGDYLLSQGIDNSVEQGSTGWDVWIHRDDHLDRARVELTAFTANPADQRFGAAQRTADRVRAQKARQEKKLRRNYVDVRTSWSLGASGPVLVTILLIIACGLVAAVTRLGARQDMDVRFMIAVPRPGINSPARTPEDGAKYPRPSLLWPLSGLQEIGHGEVWRLITPIFLHFGVLHLIFNLFWLRDLGFIIEGRRGSLWMIVLVLLVAVLSNLTQYLVDGASFGGMSGVVYGLFGYIWMKGKYAPEQGMGLHPNTVTIMLVWLAACMTGILGPVANTAHAVGLLVGVACGGAPGFVRKIMRDMR